MAEGEEQSGDDPPSQYQKLIESTIKSYLNNKLSAQETASLLTTPINKALDADNSSEDDDDDDAPYEGDIWTAILSTTRKHAYDHPAIPSLVALLAAIQDSPDPTLWKSKQQSDPYQSWRHLPGFGMEVREDWNRTLTDSPSGDDQWSCTPAQWTSMNALLAHITVTRVSNFARYAIWALRDALEDIPGQSTFAGHVANLDHYVPAAAVWVFVAGEIIYNEWILGGGEKEVEDVGGHLWEGKGFSRERWGFWKERFGWVRGQGGVEVEEETRAVAGRAVVVMEGVERGVGGR
ncbi:MAG: hypothetical protein Q9220_002859 [cf. Caloplaca sp. 1 TL-2023]